MQAKRNVNTGVSYRRKTHTISTYTFLGERCIVEIKPNLMVNKRCIHPPSFVTISDFFYQVSFLNSYLKHFTQIM